MQQKATSMWVGALDMAETEAGSVDLREEIGTAVLEQQVVNADLRE